MRLFAVPAALLFLVVVGNAQATAQARPGLEADRMSGERFLRAAGGVLAANALVWGANRFARDEPSARVGTRSWGRNLGTGFTWDADGFINNQLGHPYHGGLYFNAARVNRYGFWASVPFVAAGSLFWEFFGETTAPSINDLVNTTLGGVALGEISDRLSSRVLQRGGKWRGLAAGAVSPAGGAQRVLGGVHRQERAVSAGVEPPAPRNSLAIGYLSQEAKGAAGAQAFVEFTSQERSPFDEAVRRPFDAFEFEVEVTPGDRAIVTRTRAKGLLARRFLRRAERSQLVAGVFQEYDYVNLSSYELGGQSLSGGLLYRRKWGASTEIRAGAELRGLVLGGISSDHAERADRGYDYGPGLGSALSVSLRHGGRELLRFEHGFLWLKSISGADAVHRATFTRAEVQIPVAVGIGVGADLGIWGRDSRYDRLPPANQRVTRVRIYLVGPSS
jgi:hypothetical protein